MSRQSLEIVGAKGADAPPPPYNPVESPNTLQSKAVYRVTDLICEGEIEGLVNGHKSIYLDGVPLQAEDGSYNFQGVTVNERYGAPGQGAIGGFPDIATPYGVGVEMLNGVTITRQVTDANIDAVYVLITVPALYEQKDNGDLVGSKVSFQIQVNSEAAVSKTISGKCMSDYQVNYRLKLPAGQAPWNIKVTRTTADSTSSKLQDKTWWTSYTEIIDHKLSYPDSAVFDFEADASLFGGQIPKRSFLMRLIKVKIPSGYTPPRKDANGIWQPAVYPPAWDGTFQSPQYTSCAAWCFYDMVTSGRYGAGLPDPGGVLKWALYPLAQYCDELVDDGKGGLEPRFHLNCLLKTQQEAYAVLNTLVSVFRGMCWWSSGSVSASQDAPAAAQILASPANVIDGLFTYEGSALKARHTVALVTWNNPNNHYAPEIEVVEDAGGIALYGYRPIEIAPFGCTSHGIAHRAGKWLLDSEKTETELVKYKAGLDHAFVTPGMIVEVADPFYANARMGGRLKSAAGVAVELDQPVTLAIGETYWLQCVLPDGDVEIRQVATVPDGQEHAAITLAEAFSANPQAGAMWVMSGSDVAPRKFRVLSNNESNGGYEITALFHDPGKYARVESNLVLEAVSYAREGTSGPVLPPNNPGLQLSTYYADGGLKNMLVFSWEAAQDDRVNLYNVQWKVGDDNWQSMTPTGGFMVEHRNVQAGLYTFRVQAVTRSGGSSVYVSADIDIGEATMPDVTGLVLVDGDTATTFTGGNAKFAWTPTSISEIAAAGGVDSWFYSYVVEVVKGGSVVRTEYPKTPEYEYSFEKNTADGGPARGFTIRVYQLGNLGQISANPAVLAVSNPAPSMAGFTPAVTPSIKGLRIDWSQMPAADADLKSFRIYIDTSADPTTFAAEVAAKATGWVETGLDTGTAYKVKVVPYDAFGAGVASSVANGTPVMLEGADVNVELSGSIEITDSDLTAPGTMAKLYDRNTLSDGVPYVLGGVDKYIQYKFGLETYIDRLVVWTADANAKVYIAYSLDGSAWSWLKADLGHALDASGNLLVAADQTDAQANYLQLAAGLNIAIFPQRIVAKYCRLYLTGSYSTELYELTFVRQVIAEQIVADNLSAISANLGSIEAGFVQSQNWGPAQGIMLDLNNSVMRLGGTGGGVAAQGLYYDGSGGLFYKGAAVFTSGSSGYGNLSDAPYDLATLDPAQDNKLDGIAAGATVGATAAEAANIAKAAGWQHPTDTTKIDGGDIYTGTVTAASIAAGAITTSNLAAGAVTANEIAAGTITGDRIAAGTITGTNIQASSIVTSNIATGNITTETINGNAVTDSGSYFSTSSIAVPIGSYTTVAFVVLNVSNENVFIAADCQVSATLNHTLSIWLNEVKLMETDSFSTKDGHLLLNNIPGTGQHTYALKARNTSLTNTLSAVSRSLYVIGAKR